MYSFERILKNRCESLTTQPIERMSKFFGLNVLSGPGKLYHLCIIFGFVLIVYTSTQNVCLAYCKCSSVKSFLIWLHFCTNTLLVFILLCNSYAKPTQFQISRKELDVIDNLLLSQNLQFPRVPRFRLQIIQICFMLLTSIVLNVKWIWLIPKQCTLQVISYIVHYYFSGAITLMADCLFVNIMYMMRRRFHELNKLMIQKGRKNRPMVVYIDFLSRSRLPLKNSGRTMVPPDTETSRFIYHLLYEFAVKANADFGLHLLISSAVSLLTIIYELYEIHEVFYVTVFSTSIIITNLINALYYVIRLLFISSVCQRTKDESIQTTNILHDYSKSFQTNEMVHFSLQMIHENLVFTAFGFYEIDFGVICSILGAVTTYLVILMQLDMSKKKSTNTINYMGNFNNVTNTSNAFNSTLELISANYFNESFTTMHSM